MYVYQPVIFLDNFQIWCSACFWSCHLIVDWRIVNTHVQMTQNCTDLRKWLNVITALILFGSVYTHISWGLICIFIKNDTRANRKWWSVVRVEHAAFTLLSAHLCFPPKSPWAIFNQAKVKYLKKKKNLAWIGIVGKERKHKPTQDLMIVIFSNESIKLNCNWIESVCHGPPNHPLSLRRVLSSSH